MISVKEAVVVEGRYDKIKLESIVDGIVVTTDGFNIFKDSEKQQLLKRLADETGLIVLTDSDAAGFKIRKFISDITGGGVYHAYIPEEQGKERRKPRAGAAGLIGVEGLDNAVIEQALRRCIEAEALSQVSVAQPERRVTAADLYADGLTGRRGAAKRRTALLRSAGLPGRLSTNAMLQLLTRLYGYDGYRKLVGQLPKED